MVRRGEIWWANLPESLGSEPAFQRPVLILQADSFNQSSLRTVICAVLTSNLALALGPGNVRVSGADSGLPKPSVVNISQLVTLDRTRLRDRVKILPSRVMQLVENGIRQVLDL